MATLLGLGLSPEANGQGVECNGMNFTNVTGLAGITHQYVYPPTQPNGFVGGAVAEDFDNDGWVDLFVVQGADGPCLLYMNDQSGSFVNEAAARGAAVVVSGVGASAADYDNDGDVDIVVSVFNAPSVVLVNDGTGHFTSSFLLPTPLGLTTSSSWGDVDNDGQLELMIGQWVPRDNPTGQGLFVYKNLGGGTLANYEFRTTPAENHSLLAPRFVDVNGDRLMDIYAAADHGRSKLYLNVGGGMFSDVTAASKVGTGANDMGHTVGDYDNDGDLDLFTSDISQSGGNRLYNNNGSGVFTEAQEAAGVKDGAWGWGASFGDLDNDGDLDLYHVNGWLHSTWVGTPNRLFMNNGNGTFTDVADCAGAGHTGQGRGMLLFDYDNDGDLDIFIVNNRDIAVGGASSPGTPVLLRNDTANGNNWLKVHLNGAPPLHRHGIGSRVHVVAGGVSRMRELDASSNYLSQNPGRIAHFGIGTAAVATEARAEWLNGDSTTLYNINANQEITIDSPIATVSSRTLSGTDSVTASAAGETNPKQWLIEGVLYADPVTTSFSSGGTKDLSLMVYDTGGVTLIRKETLRVLVSGFPAITSPAPGSVLPGATATFQWTMGQSAVTQWELEIGSSMGSNDLFDSGSLPDTTLSATVNGLPVNGSTVHVRLLFTINGLVSSLDYQYTASSGSIVPEMTSPTPGTVLAGSSVNFQWAGNGADVTKWRLWIGTTPGGTNLFKNSYGPSILSQTVSNLPTDGLTIYVRLTRKDSLGVNHDLDYQYTASGSVPDSPRIVTPAPGSVLPGNSATFSWTAGGAAVTEWQLEVGSAAGGDDLFNTGSLPDTTLSTTVIGLPVDGSTVFVRLSHTIGGVVSFTDYQYQAPGGAITPAMTSPTPGTVLAGSSVNFQWASNGAPVTKWRLRGGTTVGGQDLFSLSFGAATLSKTISDLPTNGSTIHVRLTWKDSLGANHDLDYQYTASASAVVPPEIVSPAPGSVLPGSTATFQWISNGAPVTKFRFWVGTVPGGNDLFSTYGSPSLLGATVNGLPTDGLPIYVRLNWKDALGVFRDLDYVYTASGEALSAARLWNEELLEAIRRDFARPTVHARNLFHTSVAMWDAWAAYDSDATGVLHNEAATADDIAVARAEAISYAAYRILKVRFANSPGAPIVQPSFDHMMLVLGYDPNYTGTAGNTPADLGNRIAETVLAFGATDGANEANGYANQYYLPANPPLLPALPGNPDMLYPNLWQPLALDFFIDQSGNPIVGGVPPFLSPEWGQVKPFALSPDDLTVYTRDGFDYWVYHDPGEPPYLGTATEDYYKWGFEMVSVWSSHLDPNDGVMINISPGAIGNAPLADPADYEAFYDFENGGDWGTGHALNPVTGQPYDDQIVPRGDYARVLAEFWADGPHSETPPGHWFAIANYVSDHPLVVKKFAGVGPELSDLEWDVKLYLTLGGAMHDCAITAWGVKGWYDYPRPVSVIRYMADRGQSTDPNQLPYDPAGIELLPGLIELVSLDSTAPGERHEHLAGSEGKIAILAWRGPDFIVDPETSFAGVGWILAENWWPYQRPTFVTPPFAGYVSGHSTYSRAGAVVLTEFTGSPFFPGGMSEFHCPANEFLVFEDGPSVDITLQWATYNDASDQTSLSRIWGGIHPPQDDLPGRHMGQAIGTNAFDKAKSYFETTPE